MVAGEPAFTGAAGCTVSSTVLVTTPQGPDGSSVVSVKVTEPLLDAMGVKVTEAGEAVADVLLNWLELLVMVPVTAVIDQVPVEAEPPTDAPVKLYTAPEQIVLAEPALAVAAAFTVKSTVLVTALHGPAGLSVVRVSVTVPLLPAVGVNTTEEGVAVAPVLLN